MRFCTLLVTSLDLCCLKCLYNPPLHEIHLALVIVIHKHHFTCVRSFASGTGMRHICFAGASQSSNVHKIRSFKGRLQQSCACCLNSRHSHTCKLFIYPCAETFCLHEHRLKISILESLTKTKITFQKLISGNEIALWKAVVALCLSNV